jgi:hypothetical protein
LAHKTGRSVSATIYEFAMDRPVINGITFDGATKDAMQCAIRDALIAFMAATAQAQAEATLFPALPFATSEFSPSTQVP